jgi:hypothetical protein
MSTRFRRRCSPSVLGASETPPNSLRYTDDFGNFTRITRSQIPSRANARCFLPPPFPRRPAVAPAGRVAELGVVRRMTRTSNLRGQEAMPTANPNAPTGRFMIRSLPRVAPHSNVSTVDWPLSPRSRVSSACRHYSQTLSTSVRATKWSGVSIESHPSISTDFERSFFSRAHANSNDAGRVRSTVTASIGGVFLCAYLFDHARHQYIAPSTLTTFWFTRLLTTLTSFVQPTTTPRRDLLVRSSNENAPNHALQEPLRASRHLLPPPPCRPPCRSRAALRGR